MKTAGEIIFYLRWLLQWVRDLLLLADDLIAYGDSRYLCVYIDFYQLLSDASAKIKSLLAGTGQNERLTWNRLTGGDPDFPSGLLPRSGRCLPDGINTELVKMLRRFSAATDDRLMGDWPPEWTPLRTVINQVCRWSPP